MNNGTYRVQTQAPNLATVMMSPGKHGRILMQKYHERGQACPVAVVVGNHPVIFMLSGLEIPYGKSEFAAAGGIFGEPVEIFRMPRTGLPVPANAEIAFEGFIHPERLDPGRPARRVDRLLRRRQQPGPAIRIETMMHRDDPILLGAIPAVRRTTIRFIFGTYRCGAIWNQFEAAGIPEVRGVWTHEAGGSRFWTTSRSSSSMAGTPNRRPWSQRTVTQAPIATDGPSSLTKTSIRQIDEVIWAMSTR